MKSPCIRLDSLIKVFDVLVLYRRKAEETGRFVAEISADENPFHTCQCLFVSAACAWISVSLIQVNGIEAEIPATYLLCDNLVYTSPLWSHTWL